MKKLLLLLMIVPMIGFTQCVSGDCEDGFGTYLWEEEGWDFINEKTALWTYQYVGEWKNGKKHGYDSN